MLAIQGDTCLVKKRIMVILLVLFLAVSYVAVYGQLSDSNVVGVLYDDSASGLIAVSTNNLVFVGDEGGGPINRTITVVGLVEGSVTVDIVVGELYENTSATTASIMLTKDVDSISMSEAKNVTFMLDSSETAAGKYYGEILITATANNNVTTTTINVTANIGSEPTPIISRTQWIALISTAVLIFLALVAMKCFDNELFVVALTLAAFIVWFTSIITTKFDLGFVEIFNTVILATWVSHAFGYVKEKRDTKNSNITSATKIQNEGISKDIEMLQNVLGETTTHYASFNFGFEGIDETEIPKHPKILFNEQGKLSTSAWEKYRKQGSIFDLPLLYLEKYYDFIKLYNRYYSCALNITKDTNSKEFEDLKNNNKQMETFFEKFDNFRKKYDALETVLFVYMSYFLGLLGQTQLAPIKIAYPRVTRVLLKKLTDYDILDLKAYQVNEEALKKEGKLDEFNVKLDNNLSKKFKDEITEKIEKKKEELQRKFNLKATQEQKFQTWFDAEFAGWKNAKKNDDKLIKKEKLKAKISLWDLTAEDSEAILKDIYSKEDMPKFYYKIGQDFRKKYKELLNAVADLPPLPPECIEKEKIPLLIREHKLNKQLLEELGKLKELHKNGAITEDQFNAKQTKILENMNYLNTKHKKIGLLEELRQLKMLLDLGAIPQKDYNKRKKEITDALKKIDSA